MSLTDTVVPAPRAPSPGEELAEMLSRLLPTDEYRTQIALERQRAIGYAWGWQDRSGNPAEKDSAAASDFALAFAVHCAQYRLGRIGVRVSVAHAYQQWAAGTRIGDQP